MISDRQLLDLIDEVMAANAKGLSHPHELGNPSRFDLAVNLLAARSAPPGVDANQQSKTGGTQASDSLARISSSHPEDGGIREALEKIGTLCSPTSPIGEIVSAALNPAPLPIGEEREKS